MAPFGKFNSTKEFFDCFILFSSRVQGNDEGGCGEEGGLTQNGNGRSTFRRGSGVILIVEGSFLDGMGDHIEARL